MLKPDWVLPRGDGTGERIGDPFGDLIGDLIDVR